MRLPLLILCGVLIAAGALVAGRATAPVTVGASPAMSMAAPDKSTDKSLDKAAIGRIVRKNLLRARQG